MTAPIDLALDRRDLTAEIAGGALLRRTVLHSGLRVLSEAMPGASSTTVGFWVPVGSRDELDGGHGSTHFLEHLLFKGTPRRTALDIATAFDAVGGEHNALTAKEYTCYYARVRDRDAAMAVEAIADMVAASVLDAAEFESERGVILEELAMADDDPSDVAGERFAEAVFGEHPLGRPVGGHPDSVRAVSRERVLEHYREHYAPSSVIITAAGSIDHDVLVSGVQRGFAAAGWSLDRAAAPRARRSVRPTALRPGGARVVERAGEQENLILGVPGLIATDPRRTTLSVLNAVLGGGMSSRLFQEVREKRGLAYAVYSFASGYSDAGFVGMYAGCTPARSAAVAELLHEEFARLARDGITADELSRARGQLAGASALALEDSDARMSRLGRAEITLGEFADLDVAVERLERVTAADVQDLAVELASRPLSLAAVGPTPASAFAGLAPVLPEPRTAA